MADVVSATTGYDFSRAVHYHYEKFPPADLDHVRLIPPLSAAATALARYDGVLRTLHNSEILLAPLRRREAVISSRMENTVTTLDEVLRLEAEMEEEEGAGTNAKGHRSETLEVLAYARAMQQLQRRMNEGVPLSSRLFCEAHRILLGFGRGSDKRPGEFKWDQNYLADRADGRILFVPIAPDRLRDGIHRLERFMNDVGVEPLLQAAVSHVEFEALHPFADGNGRVGRIFIPLMLWNRRMLQAPHFYVSSYLESRRDDYIDLMRNVSRSDAWTAWCIFFFEAIEAQAVENLRTAEAIRDLYEDMKARFRDVLASKFAIDALDFCFASPVFRNSVFVRESRIPRPTALRMASLLHREGLLKVVRPAAGRRSAIYAFEPLLELVRP